jgi:curli biogenesis system outer membrane secretion channel CsgG
MGSASAKTTATGSAGGANSANANSSLERCSKPLGTLGLLEETHSNWYRTMNKYGVNSTVPILRLLAQQSNCFVVVERGQGFQAMDRERDLQKSGELRENSSFGKGQMVSADYGLTPTLIFKANDTGGIAAKYIKGV